MKTAVEWLIGRFHYEGFIGTYCSEEQIKSKRQIMIEIIEQAKEIEKNQSYSYDEIRTIAYNAYCLALSLSFLILRSSPTIKLI